MAVFLSTFINKVDRKGRVSVPSTFRAALKGQSFNGIVAFPSLHDPAIEACDYERMERLSDSVDELAQFSEEQADLAAMIFADAHQIPIDGDGRIILPPDLLEHAGITDRIAFVGQGRTFQLWNPDTHDERHAASRARAQARGAVLRLVPRTPGSSGS